jgi:hypothetical protein
MLGERAPFSSSSFFPFSDQACAALPALLCPESAGPASASSLCHRFKKEFSEQKYEFKSAQNSSIVTRL